MWLFIQLVQFSLIVLGIFLGCRLLWAIVRLPWTIAQERRDLRLRKEREAKISYPPPREYQYGDGGALYFTK